MKRLFSILTTVIVVIAVLLAACLVGVRLFDLQVYTVLSGSMEPKYPVGSLIYVRQAELDELKVDDVITFMADENTVVTHRIIEIVPDDKDPSVIRYRTRGDANNSPDAGLVHYKNVIGKPICTIPYLGYVAHFIQTPPTMYYSIAIGCLLVILVFLPDLFKAPKKEEEDNN